MRKRKKSHKNCSLEFFIVEEQRVFCIKPLIKDASYFEIDKEAQEIVDSIKPNFQFEEKKEFRVHLIEFSKNPEMSNVQKAFVELDLMFPNELDTLRFGAKYKDIGNLSPIGGGCCIMFPCKVSKDDRRSASFLAINYQGNNRILVEGGFGTKTNQTWYFAGLKLKNPKN